MENNKYIEARLITKLLYIGKYNKFLLSFINPSSIKFVKVLCRHKTMALFKTFFNKRTDISFDVVKTYTEYSKTSDSVFDSIFIDLEDIPQPCVFFTLLFYIKNIRKNGIIVLYSEHRDRLDLIKRIVARLFGVVSIYTDGIDDNFIIVERK